MCFYMKIFVNTVQYFCSDARESTKRTKTKGECAERFGL